MDGLTLIDYDAAPRGGGVCSARWKQAVSTPRLI